MRTLFNANSSSIRLTLDRRNRIIYWISYNPDKTLMLRKTDYNGNTTVISSSFGQSGRPAITQIGNYYYVLDSTQSVVRKFDKATDTIVQNFIVFAGAKEIIGTNGKIIPPVLCVYVNSISFLKDCCQKKSCSYQDMRLEPLVNLVF